MKKTIAILLLVGVAAADPLPARKSTSRPSDYCVANPTKCITSSDFNGVLDALSGTGDAITPKASGATVTASGSTTARTLAARAADVVNVKDYGAKGDGTTDDTAAIQAALSAAAAYGIVDGAGGIYKVSSTLTIPANVTLRNANLVNVTAPTVSTYADIVKVNTGSKLLKVKITGTGTVNKYPYYERAILQAGDGVTDVELDVEVTNLTIGVWASWNSANPSLTADGIDWSDDSVVPKRWHGKIYAHDIVGQPGVSEGYGALIHGSGFNLDVRAVNCNRHGVYLSNGARFNSIHIDASGRQDTPVQFNTYETQAATRNNTVTGSIHPSALSTGATNTAGVWIVGKSMFNRVSVDINGNNSLERAIGLQANQTLGSYPTRGNVITGCTIRGQFAAYEAIYDYGADGTIITGNTVAAYGTGAIINSSDSGSPTRLSGPFIEGNRLDGLGQNVKGILAQVSAVTTYIGRNDIRNNSTGLRVDAATAGAARLGWSKEWAGQVTIASIASGGLGTASVTLPESLRNPIIVTNPSNFTGGNFCPSSASPNANPATSITVYAWNNHTATASVTVDYVVRGD